MKNFETVSLRSPSADVLDWITSSSVFSLEKVTVFAKNNGLSDQIYRYDRLKSFIQSDLFRKSFEDQWKYETDSKWVGRPVKKAVRETILHTISNLAEDAQLESMGIRNGQFPGLDKVQVHEMDKQLRFLAEYYREYWKGAI